MSDVIRDIQLNGFTFENIIKKFGLKEDDVSCWYKGLKKPNKNRYFKINDNDEYDIMCVELTKDRYMIVDNTIDSRRVLRKHIFCTDSYARTNINTIVNEKKKTDWSIFPSIIFGI